jgi:phosphoserine phosphatase RsbU/P
VVDHTAAPRTDGPGPGVLSAALDALTEGVLLVDGGWTICFANRAGAAVLGRSPRQLTGRSLWTAVPELGGTDLSAFLLRARGGPLPSTWSGRHAPTGRWLHATATGLGALLQVTVRDLGGPPPAAEERTGPPAASAARAADDAERLSYLAEVSDSMIATMDTGQSPTRLAELAVRRLCDWAVVVLDGEDGGPGEEAWAHRDPGRRRDLQVYLTGRRRGTGDDRAVVAALRSGEPVQVPAVREELVAPSLPTEEVRAAWRRLQAATTTIVPLRARGETFGALALVNTGTRPPHTPGEIATAVEVARRGAVALDNARLYGRQLKVAETLQHSLLTPPPRLEHLQIAVRYRPAAVHQQVGGDWYDAFTQPDGATLLVIGDVVGHNVDAAAAMGQIRSILRGIAYDRPESPAQVLSRVDGVLDGLHVGTLATALVARIEEVPAPAAAGALTLRWSSAGHLPPLRLCPDGTVEALTSPPERLLGAGVDAPRADHTTPLQPGDTLVFYTDGIIEHGRTAIDEGITRLADHLAGRADQPLEELCDELLDQVGPGRADDDIALLAVRTAAGQAGRRSSPAADVPAHLPVPRPAGAAGSASSCSRGTSGPPWPS